MAEEEVKDLMAAAMRLNDIAFRVATEILGWKKRSRLWHRADGTCTGFKVATTRMHHAGDGYFRPDRHFAHLSRVIDATWARFRVRHNFRALQHRYMCWINDRDGTRIIDAEIDTQSNQHASNECACMAYLAWWGLPRDEADHIIEQELQ